LDLCFTKVLIVAGLDNVDCTLTPNLQRSFCLCQFYFFIFNISTIKVSNIELVKKKKKVVNKLFAKLKAFSIGSNWISWMKGSRRQETRSQEPPILHSCFTHASPILVQMNNILLSSTDFTHFSGASSFWGLTAHTWKLDLRKVQL